MSPKRMDAGDTIDTATHFLHRLQADNWTLESLEHSVEYAQITEKSAKLPISVTVVIRLVPIHG